MKAREMILKIWKSTHISVKNPQKSVFMFYKLTTQTILIKFV